MKVSICIGTLWRSAESNDISEAFEGSTSWNCNTVKKRFIAEYKGLEDDVKDEYRAVVAEHRTKKRHVGRKTGADAVRDVIASTNQMAAIVCLASHSSRL